MRPHFVKTVRLRRLSVRFPRHEPYLVKTVRSEQGRQKVDYDNLLTTEWYLKNGDIPPETRERNSPFAFVIGLRYSETGFRKKPINKTQSPKGFDQRKET